MFRTALKAVLEDRHSETEAMNLFSDDDIRTPDTTLVLKSPQPRQMEVPGRVDGEGKSRSHRIEAPEIEDCLRLHRSVDNAAVITLEREGSEEAELLGFVSVNETETATKQAESDQQHSDAAAQVVDAWHDLFDEVAYRAIEDLDDTHVGRDFVGWTSMIDGRIIDKTEMNDKLMPPGMVGELLIEGPILARGYLDDAEKTRRAFDDPAWLLAGTAGHAGRRGRMYKTGDLVYYRQDGRLAFVGRKDGQVRINGRRVELGEVEVQVLACVPGAKRVAVVLLQLEGLEMLATFVELDGGGGGEFGTFTASSLKMLAEDSDGMAEMSQRACLDT